MTIKNDPKARAEYIQHLKDLVMREQVYSRINAAFLGDTKRTDAWILETLDGCTTTDFLELQEKATVTSQQIVRAIVGCARLRLLPGRTCIIACYGGKNPSTSIQPLASGLRELAKSIPGFSAGKPTVVHPTDEWIGGELRVDETGKFLLQPHWKQSTGVDRSFKKPSDVVAVIGVVNDGFSNEVFVVNDRDLKASLRNVRLPERHISATDTEAWARVVWLRRMVENYGVVARAAAAATLDEVALDVGAETPAFSEPPYVPPVYAPPPPFVPTQKIPRQAMGASGSSPKKPGDTGFENSNNNEGTQDDQS